ncbi:mechanosensitive ion channel protein [Flavobacterium noncentrifugens]|uniref:Small conductance mechanosensitive channel n=1 Tax=Flavobacterium noncentrifugens TaxID=1128970 RepID=A0A1G8RUZ2_9FLAO|nr:mechanosensitive ion channel domain-containing protein [Flavobacterium noncentrifugens]GEP49591.1 mechanosensitive ion channel protein [Flavobacterium noncentrifugens]SDJ20759.1 small conductance mechanosensitive channel [Flavobacterium noncentrifugens]
MKLLTEINYLDQYATSTIKVLIDYSPKLISAILILFIGIWVIRFINSFARKIMVRRNVEPTLIEFLSDIMFWGLRIILFIAVISKLGIESSSFVAILGAAGLAVGLSLQGSLSNFAGGMLIIMFKPFKLGDTIQAQNVSGTVVDIQIFVTQLLTSNNQAIFIPNGILSNGVIVNFSQQHNRRTDLVFSVSYDTNIKDAKTILTSILDNHPKVLQHPKPDVVLAELTDSSIKFAIRAWSATSDFGEVSSDILENAKTAFDAAGISIQPFVKEFSKT